MKTQKHRNIYSNLSGITLKHDNFKLKSISSSVRTFAPAILYEDDDLCVIDKPAGFVVSRDEKSRVLDFDNTKFIVHRLDKDTSGVLIAAKTQNAQIELSKQFAEHMVKKYYTALIYGHLTPKTGRIEAGIGRSVVNRKKMSIFSHKLRMAATNYRVIDYIGPFTLLDLDIETGRTHQIRVHLSSIGFPIVGDPVYGNKKINREISKKYGLNRQFLHAREIQFILPSSGKMKSVSSKLPTDLKNMLEKLNQ